MDITLLITSLLAGMLTILAPCVLPVLPVVLAGSVTEKKWWYPYVVTLSLALSIVLFTVILKATTALIDIPSAFWKSLSGGILIVLGLVYVFPHAWVWITEKCGFTKSGASLDHAQDIGSPLLRAIATGAALGPVFSTCSPTYAFLLATVFPVSLIAGIGYTLIYALGLAVMLTLIAVGGRSLIARFRGIASETGWVKRILGVVFVLIGILIISGVDKKIETWVLDRFDVSQWEQTLFDGLMPADASEMPGEVIGVKIVPTPSEAETVKNTETSEARFPPTQEGQELETPKVIPSETPKVEEPKSIEPETTTERFPIAPEISLTEWIGSPPLTMAGLRGKVVIIDFWTFGCVNCQRTRPYLNAWYEKYRDRGLVIIGVHAPEFAYERVKANLEKAIAKEGIKYPIALDNDFTLWNSYENRYWPAFYFIDKSGYVRHSHFGEGAYAENEEVIRALLAE